MSFILSQHHTIQVQRTKLDFLSANKTMRIIWNSKLYLLPTSPKNPSLAVETKFRRSVHYGTVCSQIQLNAVLGEETLILYPSLSLIRGIGFGSWYSAWISRRERSRFWKLWPLTKIVSKTSTIELITLVVCSLSRSSYQMVIKLYKNSNCCPDR